MKKTFIFGQISYCLDIRCHVNWCFFRIFIPRYCSILEWYEQRHNKYSNCYWFNCYDVPTPSPRLGMRN